MAACFDDDSKLADPSHPDIIIGELRDTNIVSFSGNLLPFNPQVTSDYPEEALTYAWYYYSDNDNSTLGEGLPDGCRENKISDKKNLEWEVNLPSGGYTFVFEVRAEAYNYYQLQKAKVTVTTPFSDCYYVLKETSDGNSEIDLHSPQIHRSDLLTELDGTPMKGKPINLNYIFNQSYIDDQTLDYVGARSMYMFSEEDTRVFELENFKRIFDRSTIGFEPFTGGVRPCAAFNLLALAMLSDEGFYYCQPYDISPCSGRYGLSLGAGGSRFVQLMGLAMAMLSPVFWSDSEHSLCYSDYNCSSPTVMKLNMPEGVDPTELSCLACGACSMGGETVWFLLEDAASKDRYLVFVDGMSNAVSEVCKVDKGLRLASANIIAGNALQAKIIYLVSDNKLWAYSIDSKTEFEINLPGMDANATIDYVSNQYMNSDSDTSINFDHLLVATYDGGKYKLYQYNIVGGTPQSEGFNVYEGTGRVRSVRYAVPADYGSFNLIMPFHSAYIYPVCD